MIKYQLGSNLRAFVSQNSKLLRNYKFNHLTNILAVNTGYTRISISFDLHHCLNGTEYSDGLLINIMFCTTFNGVLQVKHDRLVLESMDTITDNYEYL